MAEVEEWLSSKSETITLTQAEAENFANCLIRIIKVPFIYYVSTCTAQNLILLPYSTWIFRQKRGNFFSTLHFDEIFML